MEKGSRSRIYSQVGQAEAIWLYLKVEALETVSYCYFSSGLWAFFVLTHG